MSKETVVVPDIGSDAAEVVEILVGPGDVVEIEQGLVVLESDKASMEIPSTVAGTVVEVLAKEGDELAEGTAVAVIEVAGGESAEDAAAEPEPAEEPAAAPTPDSPSPEPAPAPDVATATMDVPVPDIGTSDAVDLIEISVAVGDEIAEGDTLIVLESDKASMEVPSPAAGVVETLSVEEGQQIKQGDLILTLKTTGSGSPATAPETPSAPAVAPQPAAAPAPVSKAPAPAAAPVKPAAGTDTAKSSSDVYAGPAVRQLAREFGVPLTEVSGSGPRGRIIKEDLHDYVKRRLNSSQAATTGAGIPAIPDVDFSAFGPVDVVPRTKIDKVTAANMQRSWLNAPHVTQFDDADITEMEAFRKSLKAEAEKRGTRLTPLPFLLKACAVALARHEKLNSSLSDGGETVTFKRYIHIGMAVDTPAGLVVPVIRDVDQKSLWDLAAEVLELAAKARDRKLKPAEMQGGGFTISSLGGIGGRGFTPIVNAPEVAILGVSRAQTQPVWDGNSFQPRLQLPLALSYDHRVINGGDGGRFLSELCELLGDIRKLLL